MLIIYRSIINILFPIIIIFVLVRTLLNKEDKVRFKEKLFSSSFNVLRDKKKKLIWFHAASIGELNSIIPLVNKLNKEREFDFLITTTTLSSSNLMKQKLFRDKNIIHRFLPIDKLSLVKKFLDEWSPNLIFFVDSEIWPNFLLEIKKRYLPIVLLNARITKKTFLRWNLIPKSAAKIFDTFTICLSSSKESKKYLDKLNVKNTKYYGNLKLTLENISNNLDNKNKEILKNNKFWCAVSTHEKEDVFCLKTHLEIKKIHQNIKTIIIPRHLDRVKKIKTIGEKLSLKTQILSDSQLIDDNKEIIVINSYGVISNYLSFCKSVFIGKSMIKKLKHVSGQNPIEAAKLGCKIYHGPYVYNFKEIYDQLNEYGISSKVEDEIELANNLTDDFNKLDKINKNQLDIINNLGIKILNDTYNEINKISF